MLQNIENPEISETSIPNESNEKDLDSYLDSSNNSSKSNKNINKGLKSTNLKSTIEKYSLKQFESVSDFCEKNN